MNMKPNALFLLPVLVLAACNREAPAPEAPQPMPGPQAVLPGETLPVGGRLFGEHCAQCHGPQAQGHPDWQTPNDGSFSAAPPLDATGPAVNKTKQALVATIKGGVRKDGIDLMPGYRGRLSDDEIGAVISWFQALWPPETLAVWMKTNGAATPSH